MENNNKGPSNEKKKFPEKPIKKYADKIVDTNYKNSKNKNPFTQVAENAVKELSFTMRDGHIENNEGTTRLKTIKEAVEMNEALDKNFQDQKNDDYIKQLRHWGIEESQKKHPDYPKVSNPPILRNNINRVSKAAPVKLNPTVNKYKAFKEKQKKALEDKKFDEQFKKDYSDQAMENYVRGKVNKNIRAGKAPYEDLPTSYLIVGEHAKDKAKAKLKAIQTQAKMNPEIQDISKKITELQKFHNDIEEEAELKRQFDEAKRTRIDPDIHRGLGSFDPRGKK